MNWKDAKDKWLSELTSILGEKDASLSLHLLLTTLLPKFGTTDLNLSNPKLTSEDVNKIDNAIEKLKKHTPIQYIIHKAWFRNLSLYVNEHTLIPRPETEELVSLVLAKNQQVNPTVFDIGTGSGCIALSIKDERKQATVTAIDVSEKTLKVARQNAKAISLDVDFLQMDILDKKKWSTVGKFDVIVSNPPYITQYEKKLMHKNVLDYEPSLALFVDNEQPYIFYSAIADFGLEHLDINGQLFFECNEFNAIHVVEILKKKGYQNVELHRDMQGKNRMISAQLIIA